jgi:polyferredoxin
MHFPFDKAIFMKAMKHALGLGIVGFAFILVVWGEIVPADIVGMSLAVPLVAYLIHVIMLFDKED